MTRPRRHLLGTHLPGRAPVSVVILLITGLVIAAFGPAPSARATIDPGSETNLLLKLDKKAVRCLEDDADGVLPFDVEVRIKRKKQTLADVPESRSWLR